MHVTGTITVLIKPYLVTYIASRKDVPFQGTALLYVLKKNCTNASSYWKECITEKACLIRQCNVSSQNLSVYVNDVNMFGVAVMEVVENEYMTVVWKHLGKQPFRRARRRWVLRKVGCGGSTSRWIVSDGVQYWTAILESITLLLWCWCQFVTKLVWLVSLVIFFHIPTFHLHK